MIGRFQGAAGRPALIAALENQQLVRHSTPVADAIAKACSLEAYGVGEKIITQGATDTDILFLLAGEAAIWVNGRHLATRKAGQHVGEMAAIDPTAVRSADVVATKPTVVARISEVELIATANAHPAMWRAMATELANRLRERSQHHRSPNLTPYLFIGSSSEQLPVAREVQSKLAQDPVTVKVWTDGVFGASTMTMTALIDEARKADFAVFVLNSDDVVRSRGAQASAPRDNVIFEFGMFIGALGLERVIGVAVREKNRKMPSDLLGVTLLSYLDTGDIAADLGAPSSAIRKRLALGPL